MRSWNEGKTYFIHQDGLGTERMRTDGSGTVAATFFNLPFGDDQQVTTPIPNSYPAPQEQKFAMNDYDGDSNTFHAQFRNYNLSMGRWLSPDPKPLRETSGSSAGAIHIELPGRALISVESGADDCLVRAVLESLRK
jgi:RHS repeat-associated protein